MSRRRQKQSILPIIIVSILVMLGIGAVSICIGILFYSNGLKAVEKNNPETIAFRVEKGQSVSSIIANLHQKGLIRNQLVTKIYLRQSKLASAIQAGDFSLSKSMSVPILASALTKAEFDQFSVTLLEGWRKEEVAEELARVFAENGFAFDASVFLSQPSVKEGFVYPETYFFADTSTEAQVAQSIAATFAEKISPLQSKINDFGYSLDEILTMASIVEREAREDRAIVAGILWKRLENDWPLQVDATLQYAKGYNSRTGEWWTPPLAADKEIDSPYNSYANIGLPPAPIANPSLDAIQATITPVETEYWFYITAPDGTMYYGVTYDDHLRNVNRYLR